MNEEREQRMDELYTQLQAIVEELHDKLEKPDLEIESRKIMQKLNEAKYDKGNVTPLADCMLAILLAARSGGHSVRSVFDALAHVAEDIKGKNWKKMPDGTYRVV